MATHCSYLKHPCRLSSAAAAPKHAKQCCVPPPLQTTAVQQLIGSCCCAFDACNDRAQAAACLSGPTSHWPTSVAAQLARCTAPMMVPVSCSAVSHYVSSLYGAAPLLHSTWCCALAPSWPHGSTVRLCSAQSHSEQRHQLHTMLTCPALTRKYIHIPCTSWKVQRSMQRMHLIA